MSAAAMAQPPHLSTLCELCEHINFTAILTPREYDSAEGKTRAVYRPELSGNGLSPVASWMSTKERRNLQHPPGSIQATLPIIKTAYYDDLSASASDDDDDVDSQVYYRDYAVHVVSDGGGSQDDNFSQADEEGARVKEGEDDIKGTDDNVHNDDDEDDGLSEGSRAKLAADLSDVEYDQDGSGNDRDSLADEWDEESITTISTWSGLSHFTENNRIDLNKQAAGNWNYSHGDLYYLGSIWDVRSRRYRCDLCALLWDKMRNNPVVREEFITKSRCILKLMELNGRRVEDSTKVISTLNLTFIYGYKLGDPRQTEWIVRNPVVLNGAHRDVCELDEQIPPDQIPHFQDSHYGEARWKDERCNYGLLKGWLQTCTTKHDHPSLKSDVKVKMRLIDVVQMCLIEFDASESVVPDYVALSYTWGTSKPRNMLQTSDMDHCSASGFFKQENLNATFRDSIILCSNMGQKYLWIDALCIIQDDAGDKLQQIPQMREIYGRSLFTIVAAYGDNADAGLPRVWGAGSSRFKLELKDIRVQLRGSCKIYAAGNKLDIGFTENYMRGCAYLSRAWTFQEGFLSPRLLIFTQDKVYWECDRCTWCDDTHWESDTVNFVGLKAIKGSTPTDIWNDRFERHAHDLRPADEEEFVPPVDSYAAVVKEYSNRSLSWDTDVLHACNGVLAYIKDQLQSEFLFGLREKHFGNDLLFNYWTAVAPRFPGKSPTESEFPSWSWSAWKGSIQIANQARGNSYDLAENLVPCDGVRCFILQVDRTGSRGLRVINQGGGWKFEPEYVRRGEGIYDPTTLNFEYDSVTGALKKPHHPGYLATTHSHNDFENVGEQAEIPNYDQDVTLDDLKRHPAFDTIQPSFHITFKTFSTLVVVVLDYDDYVMRMSNITIGGTVTLRSEGVWGNKDTISRKVYACRRTSSASHSGITHAHQQDLQENACPCCGKDPKRKSIPDGYELGPYLGRLPAMSTARDQREYLKEVPDGLYRMLWMNNNQLPMFGHLLCKPVSPSASMDGANWDNEIMQRVSSVIGPTQIITRECQELYCAKWGTHVLA